MLHRNRILSADTLDLFNVGKGKYSMHMKEIRDLAKNYAIKTSRASKTTLVKKIQRAEGNFDCFGTALDGYCNQFTCLWREDCMKQSAAQRKVG